MPTKEYELVTQHCHLEADNLVFYGLNHKLVGPYNTVSGYVGLTIEGTYIALHRAVYILYYGEIPDKYEVDHIDTDKENNRPNNLRAITKAQNCQNRPTRYDNKSGHRGVSWDKSTGKYRVEITVDQKTIRLGRFKTLEEAVAARKAAEAIYHPFAGSDNRIPGTKVQSTKPPKFQEPYGKIPRTLAPTRPETAKPCAVDHHRSPKT